MGIHLCGGVTPRGQWGTCATSYTPLTDFTDREKTMTTPQDQFTQVARQGQDAVAKAMRTWTESVQSMVGSGTSAQSGLPSPQQVLDNVFDFAEQLLASQRAFATRVLAVGLEANDAATAKAREAIESLSAHTVAATESATDKTVNTVEADTPGSD